MSYDYSKLNGKIREVCKTQEKFALKLGIGRTTLSLRLNGKREFSQSEIKKSVEILGIPHTEINEYFFIEKV